MEINAGVSAYPCWYEPREKNISQQENLNRELRILKNIVFSVELNRISNSTSYSSQLLFPS